MVSDSAVDVAAKLAVASVAAGVAYFAYSTLFPKRRSRVVRTLLVRRRPVCRSTNNIFTMSLADWSHSGPFCLNALSGQASGSYSWKTHDPGSR